MGRKSSIDRVPAEVRSHIERRLRENRLTLAELIADLQQHFPAADKPSRSAIGRYKVSFDQMVRRLREQEAMSRLLVEELGENPDERAGALFGRLNADNPTIARQLESTLKGRQKALADRERAAKEGSAR